MKRKLLIGLLPILMTLSACGGTVSNDSPREEDTFLQDALAHEEIFGESQGQSLLKAARNLTPVDSTTPLIAVQQQEYTSSLDSKNYLAVRYVAAVKLTSLSTSLEWSGSVYEDDGDLHKSYATLSAQKVYTTIYDGSDPLTIGDFNNAQSPKTDYTHFVTYTIRKIPTDKTAYFIKASLSVGGAAANKVVATTIDLNKQVSFDPAYTGYFLRGTIGGSAEETHLPADVNNRGYDPENYDATFAQDLVAGDNFYILYNKTTSPAKFMICDPALSGDVSTDSFTKTNGKFTVKADKDNHYALFLNKSNQLVSDHKYDIKFNVTMPSSGINSLYVTGGFDDWSCNTYNLTEVESTKVYSGLVRLDEEEHVAFKFYNGSFEFSCSNRKINVDSDATYSFTYGEPNYYVVGILNGVDKWGSISADRKLTQLGSSGEFKLNMTLNNGDKLQVVRVENDGSWEWHGCGDSHKDDYWITADGTYSIYFGNNYDGISVETANTKTYYLCGAFNGWTQADGDYAMTECGKHKYTCELHTESATTLKVMTPTPEAWYDNGSGDVSVPAGDWNMIFDLDNGTHISWSAIS